MSTPARPAHITPPYQTWLRDQYVVAGRPMQSLADELGVHVATVHRHLIEAGIPRRRRGPVPAARPGVQSDAAT